MRVFPSMLQLFSSCLGTILLNFVGVASLWNLVDTIQQKISWFSESYNLCVISSIIFPKPSA